MFWLLSESELLHSFVANGNGRIAWQLARLRQLPEALRPPALLPMGQIQREVLLGIPASVWVDTRGAIKVRKRHKKPALSDEISLLHPQRRKVALDTH